MLRKDNIREFSTMERAQFSGPGIRALNQLKLHWRLTDSNIAKILGRPSRTELKEWMRAAQAYERVILTNEQLHRIAVCLKVFESLTVRYEGAQEKCSRWLRTPHSAAIFNGKPPLTLLEHSDLDNVLAVRNYVTTWKIDPELPVSNKKKIKR